MNENLKSRDNQFGTSAVFLTAISTILGAIMFLRMGYAVGNLGFWETLLIIVLGHIVTIATALAISEIATNQKVEGGGEYFMISRSFGLNIGGAIGMALYLSQSISVAFYIVACTEAFSPLLEFIAKEYQIIINDSRFISLPLMGILTFIMLKSGAKLGLKTLYFIIGILFISILLFFIGTTEYAQEIGIKGINEKISEPESFFYVFAICFPAFTGMTAGVGLSGDLKEPGKSIPIGTISATIVGMIIYIFIAYKLATSASPNDLNENQLIMSEIAIWSPIIPIGLACATISSALGSIMVAPRTLQALANDRITPSRKINTWLSKKSTNSEEPFNTTIITCIIAFIFIFIGDVNFIAKIITMIFMVTYGSLCLISFLQHFASNPAYRPRFRSRWYISLTGAVMCIWIMFEMSFIYALLSLISMVLIYLIITLKKGNKEGLSVIFQGVTFQLGRKIQVFIQKKEKEMVESWRPSVICISDASFDRFSEFDVLRWISYKYGFGTYIHFIRGYYNNESKINAEEAKKRLIKLANTSHSNVYIRTLISPSLTTAIVQIVQLPGVSGKENNMLLFEYSKNSPKQIEEVISSHQIIIDSTYDVCILGSSNKGFGYKTEIHIWITEADYNNANLMILLGYIMLGHPDWKEATIRIYAVFAEHEIIERRTQLIELIESGRLPISISNIKVLSRNTGKTITDFINDISADADLIILGFDWKNVIKHKSSYFSQFTHIGNTLFINSTQEKTIN